MDRSQSEPEAKRASFVEAISRGYRFSFIWDGFASRSEFWYWHLFLVLTNLLLNLLGYGEFVTLKQYLILSTVFILSVLPATLALWVRRGQDGGIPRILVVVTMLISSMPLALAITGSFFDIHEMYSKNSYLSVVVETIETTSLIGFILLFVIGLSTSKEKISKELPHKKLMKFE